MGKTFKRKVKILLCFSLLPFYLLAQSIDPPPPPPPDGIDPPPSVPINAHLVFLFVAGVIYMGYFFYKHNINKFENNGM